MAPRAIDRFAHGTPPSGRIRHGNPKSANVDGPMPTLVFGPGQVLHPRVLGSVVYGKHTLEAYPDIRILEFTYAGGQYPLLSPTMVRFSILET